MARKLEQEIRQRKPFGSPEEEAFLNLQRTASLLMQAFGRDLKPHGLTPAQYNALRILRGAAPAGLTCGEIGDRLVSPGPDVTRLLDRLQKATLVERASDETDRRVVRARITRAGQELLARIDAPVLDCLRRLLEPLGRQRLRTLIELLELARPER